MKTRCIFFTQSVLCIFFFCAFFLCSFFSHTTPTAHAAEYQRAALGDTITIGEFVYDDDLVASSTAGCIITIYDPSNTLKVNAAAMTGNVNGWTYYNYAIGLGEAEGNWPTFMTCGSISNGDLIRVDKTFVVGNTIAASSTIAEAVWGRSVRTLTGFGSLAADVWSDAFAPTRRLTDATLTGGGAIGTLSDIVSATSSLNAILGGQISSVSTQVTTVNNNALSASSSLNALLGGQVTALSTQVGNASSSLYALLNSSIGNVNSTVLTASSSLYALLNSQITSGNSQVISSLATTIGNASSSLYTLLGNAITGVDTRVLNASTSLYALLGTDVSSILTQVNTANTNIANASSSLNAILSGQLTTIGNKIESASSSLYALLDGAGGGPVDLSSVLTKIDQASSSLNTQIIAAIQSASSSLAAEILTNRSLISALNNISAADVWAVGTRSLTDYGTTTIASSTAYEVWNRAASQLTGVGTIGKRVADNLDAAISTRGTSSLTANDVWSAATRSLTDYDESDIATAAATAVWANGARTLTNYGNDITAADVWDVLTSSLTTVDSIGKLLATNIDTTISSRASTAGTAGLGQWTVTMSDYSAVQAGETYRTRVQVLNGTSTPTAPFAAPTVTLYDPERNTVVSGVAMTNVSTGIYEYTYSVASSASQGVWEAVISTQVESGKTVTNNDYWIVAGSPAQVIINSVTTTAAPTVSANVTITNEGLAGYEYQYEWCVVGTVDNACGGGDDVYRGTGAKFINPGEDFNTNLTATVPNAGSYYFKLVVYFGTERSGSSRTFTIAGSGGSGGSGGGGGGGGGGSPSNPPTSGACKGADLNGDNRVNSVDFSILLAFWRKVPPFTNTCVDINKDQKVNSVDFSILLSQWGTAGTAYVPR